MEIKETDNKKNHRNNFSSSEVIEMVLKSIGLTRENMSTYNQYLYPNGNCLRLRVSNHGIYLQHWFDKNRKARMEGQKIPKLDTGVNIALTFQFYFFYTFRMHKRGHSICRPITG